MATDMEHALQAERWGLVAHGYYGELYSRRGPIVGHDDFWTLAARHANGTMRCDGDEKKMSKITTDFEKEVLESTGEAELNNALEHVSKHVSKQEFRLLEKKSYQEGTRLANWLKIRKQVDDLVEAKEFARMKMTPEEFEEAEDNKTAICTSMPISTTEIYSKYWVSVAEKLRKDT